jgi:hypothetical protein
MDYSIIERKGEPVDERQVPRSMSPWPVDSAFLPTATMRKNHKWLRMNTNMIRVVALCVMSLYGLIDLSAATNRSIISGV